MTLPCSNVCARSSVVCILRNTQWLQMPRLRPQLSRDVILLPSPLFCETHPKAFRNALRRNQTWIDFLCLSLVLDINRLSHFLQCLYSVIIHMDIYIGQRVDKVKYCHCNPSGQFVSVWTTKDVRMKHPLHAWLVRHRKKGEHRSLFLSVEKPTNPCFLQRLTVTVPWPLHIKRS